MITLDGSQGEGGGQILRSSLALSLLTGQPFKIENIRGRRPKPGLMRQHLTAVNAAADVGNATVEGATLRSRELTFQPDAIQPGNYDFSIATAGSVTLVLQTVLPALMLAGGPSTLSLTGGTHNPMAPPHDFLDRSYVPQIEKMGPRVKTELTSYGFHPAGGGQFNVEIQPSESLSRLDILQRGRIVRRRVIGIVSGLPTRIAECECDRIRRKLNWNAECIEIVQAENPNGPGNMVVVEITFENITAIFTCAGHQSIRSEQVADNVVRSTRRYLKTDAPVCQYLADQLMLPMGIGAHFGTGGGCFRTRALSKHSQTHLDILGRFLNLKTETTENDGVITVSINPIG